MEDFQKRIWKPQKQNVGFSSLPELNIQGTEFQKMNMRLFHTVMTLTTKVCFTNSATNILQKCVTTRLHTMNSGPSHLVIISIWNMVTKCESSKSDCWKENQLSKVQIDFYLSKSLWSYCSKLIYFMYFIEIIYLCLIHNALDLVIQLQSQN